MNEMNANIMHENWEKDIYKDVLRTLYGDRYCPDLGGADGMVKDFTIQDFYKLVDEVGWVIIIDCSETDIDIDIYDDYIE